MNFLSKATINWDELEKSAEWIERLHKDSIAIQVTPEEDDYLDVALCRYEGESEYLRVIDIVYLNPWEVELGSQVEQITPDGELDYVTFEDGIEYAILSD